MKYLSLIILIFIVFVGCSKEKEQPPAKAETVQPSKESTPKSTTNNFTVLPEDAYKKTDSGLKYAYIKKGKGRRPKAGDKVVVHYDGWLTDGTMFDSSYKRGKPFEFVLMYDPVIKGWEEGLKLMRVGDKVQFIIPPGLGYGQRGYPPVIPPNATLIFEVELLKIES